MRGGGRPGGVFHEDGSEINEYEVWNWEKKFDGSYAGRGTCIGWLNPNKFDANGKELLCIDADAFMRAAKAIRPDAFPYGKEQMTHMLYNAGLLQETDEKRRSKFVQVRGLSAKGRGLESVLVISQDLLLDGLVEGPVPTDGPSGDQPLKAPVIPAINDVAATPAAD
jgi:hypothetical protein